MPHTAYDDDELGLHPGWDEHLDPNIRKEIRAAKVTERENADLRDRLASLERERLLTRAGIPADKRGEAFAKLYEGDASDPEQVKSEFESLFGPVATGESDEGDPAAGDRRVAAAGAAGSSEGTPGSMDLADAIRNAKDANEVKALVAQAAQLTTWQPGQMIPRLPEDV